MLAVVIPYSLAAAVTLLLTMYWIQPDMTTMLYASLPAEYKTPLWFTLSFLQEASQFFYGTVSASLIFPLHMLIPGTLDRALKALAKAAKSCRGRPKEVERKTREIRVIQLVVGLFNVGHRNIIYCLKRCSKRHLFAQR